MVYVRWRDSMRETGWRSMDEAVVDVDKPLDAHSVGFIVAESESALMLALNHQAIDGHLEMVGETLIIPREAIVEQRALVFA
jgi:hypothetical protein